MKFKLPYILPFFLLAVSACNSKDNSQSLSKKNPLIFPKGQQINNNNFTGTAYLQMLVNNDSNNPTAIGNVTFEPGARTKWHSHPGGQILLVTDGVGYYQEKGQTKKIVQKGDIIKCPPNVEHWHGASADKPFVQLAITNNDKEKLYG